MDDDDVTATATVAGFYEAPFTWSGNKLYVWYLFKTSGNKWSSSEASATAARKFSARSQFVNFYILSGITTRETHDVFEQWEIKFGSTFLLWRFFIW